MPQFRPKPEAFRTRPIRSRRTMLAVLTVGLFATILGAAHAQEAADSCVERYHASLRRIAEAEYQTVKAAGSTSGASTPGSFAGDSSLPGMLLFPPTSLGKRTTGETAALRIVASLARSKGRASGGTDEDARWMGDRLRVSLADYLTQSPSPYLCSGVPDYIATLRGFAGRLGMTPIQRDRLVATQKAVAERSVAEALRAMKPVPLPLAAPAVRPAMGPFPDLRPAAGLERIDDSMATGSTAAPSSTDPDLPPLKPAPSEDLANPADLVGAIDRLSAAAKAGGFITATPNAMPIGGALAASATAYPVLARLAETRPLVLGRPLVSDRAVQMKLSAAFSSIEALDYLMRARADGGDPLAVAIDATFEAILKANAADCTCAK
ncbi:hypothetical protein ASG43_20200 [Aureimonas sp. Leaf454]|uniref:hypothetical protein n=1 Tax=Aureimonas sp. Leaf454 TaxID=1736381 RepID=UPI0006F62C8A|nr:hypothetical protein [Aureimonas sp. Leaf454]KQT52377.1 hypothetical protein ASG43_20200 [Aureimonas sp. Leaf454]